MTCSITRLDPPHTIAWSPLYQPDDPDDPEPLATWRFDLVPDASVDLACAVQVLRELPASTVQFALDHLRRVVRPGGALYVRDHVEGHDLTGLPTDDLIAEHGFALEFAPQVRDRLDLHGLPRLWRRVAGR